MVSAGLPLVSRPGAVDPADPDPADAPETARQTGPTARTPRRTPVFTASGSSPAERCRPPTRPSAGERGNRDGRHETE